MRSLLEREVSLLETIAFERPNIVMLRRKRLKRYAKYKHKLV